MTLLLNYLLNTLWQLPLLTLAAWLIAGLSARATPADAALSRHRVWVTALLLEAFLPACAPPAAFLRRLLHLHRTSTKTALIRITVAPGGSAPTHLPHLLLLTIASLYLATILYALARLIHGLLRNKALVRSATDLDLLPRPTGLKGVRLAATPQLQGPVTLGIVQPILMLPAGFLETLSDDDSTALLAHEAAHIRRHDFALNLLYTILALPIAFHPALWFTRARLAESREMVCDALASRVFPTPTIYAHSLLRLASALAQRPPMPTLNAIGFLDANSFERRLMHLTDIAPKVSSPRRLLLTSAALTLTLLTTASALAFHIELPPGAGQAHLSGAENAARPAQKQMPVYPAEAKANHDTLDGPVILHVLIGKDGTVENIVVKQSLRRDYDISALEAVKQWRWEPFLVNGVPSEVDTDVTVNYNIDHSHDRK